MNDNTFLIKSKKVGENQATFIVAEVAQAHDGSLGAAHAYIDAIASTGADAVKFQTHIADAESSMLEPFRVRFSLQDETRYEYWKRMEFTFDQWKGLASHAADKGLIFLSSPFSVQAIELLVKIGMSAWKIASGEVSNPLLLDRMLKTGSPILLSTGMSPLSEVDQVVAKIKKHGNPLLVMQCTSKYPVKPEDVGLNMLNVYRDRYQILVGLSDHSGKIYPGLAAATLGASMVEVHVTMSYEQFGPDVPASLTTSDLKTMVDGIHFINHALNHPVKKDEMAVSLAEMKKIFGQSLTARVQLTAGQVISVSDLSSRKPGTIIPVSQVDAIVGKKVLRDIPAGDFILPEDIQN